MITNYLFNGATNHKFDLGDVYATPGAIAEAEEKSINLMKLLERHHSGDWGDLCEEDKKENEFSVEHGFRIFSSYEVNDCKIWIITEHDRSVTTILLPKDY